MCRRSKFIRQKETNRRNLHPPENFARNEDVCVALQQPSRILQKSRHDDCHMINVWDVSKIMSH